MLSVSYKNRLNKLVDYLLNETKKDFYNQIMVSL